MHVFWNCTLSTIPLKTCFVSVIRKMLHKKGAVNYKNDVLIDIIEEILPHGQTAWEAIAIAYQEKTSNLALSL